MKYIEFRLAEGYKEVTQKFSQEVELSQVQDIITKYKDLVNRNQVQGNERNIDWWGKQGWKNFEKFVNTKSEQQSQTQQKKRTKTGNSYTLAESNEWLIVVPLDKDASCFHGKGTDWCTAKPQHDHFAHYFMDNNVTLIYFLQKQTGAKWACAVYSDGNEDWFDINDNQIGNGDFSNQTGIPLDQAMKYVAMVSNKSTDVGSKANASRQGMQSDLKNVHDMIAALKTSGSRKKSLEIETLLLRVRKAEPLQDYMYIVSNGEPVEMNQNMQTLILSHLPEQLQYISNVTPKSFVMLIKDHPYEITNVITRHKDLALRVFKSDPNYIPDARAAYEIQGIDRDIQKLFIEHDPWWIIGLEEQGILDPALLAQKDKILRAWFSKNPQVFGIVIEPGLTDLSFFQPLTQEEYDYARAQDFPDDSFDIIDRNLQRSSPE